MELSGHLPPPPCWLQSWVPGYCSCNSCTFAPFHSPLPRAWPRELALTQDYSMKPYWGLLSTCNHYLNVWLPSAGPPVKNSKEWLPSVHAGIWECMQGSTRYCSCFYIPRPSPSRFLCWVGLWPSPVAWTFRVPDGGVYPKGRVPLSHSGDSQPLAWLTAYTAASCFLQSVCRFLWFSCTFLCRFWIKGS